VTVHELSRIDAPARLLDNPWPTELRDVVATRPLLQIDPIAADRAVFRSRGVEPTWIVVSAGRPGRGTWKADAARTPSNDPAQG